MIAGLQTELQAVKAALGPCQGEIKELKAHVARLDSKLSVELEKEEGASSTCLTVRLLMYLMSCGKLLPAYSFLDENLSFCLTIWRRAHGAHRTP